MTNLITDAVRKYPLCEEYRMRGRSQRYAFDMEFNCIGFSVFAQDCDDGVEFILSQENPDPADRAIFYQDETNRERLRHAVQTELRSDLGWSLDLKWGHDHRQENDQFVLYVTN